MKALEAGNGCDRLCGLSTLGLRHRQIVVASISSLA